MLTGRLCFGAQTVDSSPDCDGPDVRAITAIAPDGERIETKWCLDCRRMAIEEQGYIILTVR